MYKPPKIVNPISMSARGYVKVYIHGKRYRFYDGRQLNIECTPNRCRTWKQREKSLQEMMDKLKTLLSEGWMPALKANQGRIPVPAKPLPINIVFRNLVDSVKAEKLSHLYFRNVVNLTNKFLKFLTQENLLGFPVSYITTDVITRFLNQYRSTGTNYMNTRRTLAALFSRLVRDDVIEVNPVLRTQKMKQFPEGNHPYSEKQLGFVLDAIKSNNSSLHLCCLIMYGCFLRPHQEIRLLTRSSFNDDMTRINLAANRNKSRKTRTVPVPEYVRQVLFQESKNTLPDACNIFTGTTTPYNMSYFNTVWTRLKLNLVKQGHITNKHSLYSFRHTAAINMYIKTKDAFKVQRALGHSSLTVTLTYLRNLGQLIDTNIEDLPDL